MSNNSKETINRRDDKNCHKINNKNERINKTNNKLKKFKFNENNCEKLFSNPLKLKEHELNDLCGYSFQNAINLNTICGNKSILRYRQRTDTRIKDRYVYKCIYKNCNYGISNAESINRHIHKKKFVSQLSQTNRIDSKPIN
jgi:hypothetical protein